MASLQKSGIIDESVNANEAKTPWHWKIRHACCCFPEHASTSIDLQSLLVALPLVLPWPMMIHQLREDVCHPMEFKMNLRSLNPAR